MSDRILAAIERTQAWLASWSDARARAVSLLGLLAVIGGAIVAVSQCSGCSAGPAFVTPTTPQSVRCGDITISIGALPTRDATVAAPSGTDATAGLVVSDNDCNIDRLSAEASPQTTGNEVRDNTISPRVSVPIGGTGGGTP